MKIAYCTNVRLPSERAHGHQVARVTNALAKLGHDVHVFAPYRDNPLTQSFWDYHHVDRRVKFTIVPSFDGIGSHLAPGWIGLMVMTMSYCRKLRLILKRERYDLLYTRTPEILRKLLTLNIPVILELHKLPRWWWQRSVFVKACSQCKVIVCLTSPMRDELVRWGVAKHSVMVAGDAVDLEQFSDVPQSNSGRMILGLPGRGAFLVGYAGSLRTMGKDKGVSQISDAVAFLRRKRNVSAVIAGGPAKAIERMRQKDPVNLYLGYLDQDRLQAFYGACDVLVYPAPINALSDPYFSRDTSPLKLFEYMASGKPIISADLPPIRDLLDEDTAYFCRAGDYKSLADAIEDVANHPEEARVRAKKAQARVREHTWDKRMHRILSTLASV